MHIKKLIVQKRPMNWGLFMLFGIRFVGCVRGWWTWRRVSRWLCWGTWLFKWGIPFRVWGFCVARFRFQVRSWCWPIIALRSFSFAGLPVRRFWGLAVRFWHFPRPASQSTHPTAWFSSPTVQLIPRESLSAWVPQPKCSCDTPTTAPKSNQFLQSLNSPDNTSTLSSNALLPGEGDLPSTTLLLSIIPFFLFLAYFLFEFKLCIFS